MLGAKSKIANWIRQQLPSRWPGVTVRKRDGEPDFIRGVVHTINRNGVWIETEKHTVEPLMGAAFPLYCANCAKTIPGSVTYQRPPEERHFCPYCGPTFVLRELVKGEKVRLHYRFSRDGSSAQWFGEKWDW
jgi:hypothetical protein